MELTIPEYPTPFFYFDTQKLAKNIARLRRRLGSDVRICFSVKSNPFMTQFAAQSADYVEVCSDGELEICERLHIEPEKIVFGGIAKTADALYRAANLPVAKISIESITQLKMLASIAAELGTEQNVLLRLSSGNQFGMEEETVQDIFAHMSHYPGIRFLGIHYYSGTQKKNQKIKEDLERMESFLAACSIPNLELEYGPGMGVPLFQNKTDQSQIELDTLCQGCKRLTKEHLLTIEAGRFLTTDIGCYITRIVEIKQNRDRKFYIVDGGTHQLHYYGQVAGHFTPYVRYAEEHSQPPECVAICGSLCAASDILVNRIELPEGRVGDRLVFGNAGAYAVTEANTLFLSHPMAGVLIRDGTRAIQARPNRKTCLLNMAEVEETT